MPEPQSAVLATSPHPPYLENHVPGGTRTPDPRLRRQLLYPTELQPRIVERVMGIEPTRPAWKAGILPLNYTRTVSQQRIFYHNTLLLSRIFLENIFVFYNLLNKKLDNIIVLW